MRFSRKNRVNDREVVMGTTWVTFGEINEYFGKNRSTFESSVR